MGRDRKFAIALSVAGLAIAASAPGLGQATSNQDKADPSGIISSYLGPLGLRADWAKYVKANGVGKSDAQIVDAFFGYAQAHNLDIPPGLGGNDLPS